MFNARFYIFISAFSGALSITLGAFGAHGLKKIVSPTMLTTFQTGVQYQFIHSLALLALGLFLLMPVTKAVAKLLKWSANLMIVGIILFSGSLYTMTFMSVSGGFPTWLGPITPIGGLAFIMGWIFLMVAALKLPNDEQ
jgi:uncharacterized membrane protein YgdD (TMEM256/DUF423 family)